MTTASANLVVFEWEGVIDYVHEHQVDAAPESIFLGNKVSGTLRYDRTESDSVVHIHGNISGSRYTFTDSILLEFIVGDDVWRFFGATISLKLWNIIGPTTLLFQSQSTSDTFEFESFPNFAGNFNADFFAQDEVYPLAFWSSPDLEFADFDITHFTSGGGGISTVLLDVNGDIIDGYSFSFDVTNLTITTIPEPSTFWLLMGLTPVAWRLFLLTRSQSEPVARANTAT